MPFAAEQSSDSGSRGFNGFEATSEDGRDCESSPKTAPERIGEHRKENIFSNRHFLWAAFYLDRSEVERRKSLKWSGFKLALWITALKEHAMVWHLSVIELLELRDGALTKKKSHRLKVHLEACRSCRS